MTVEDLSILDFHENAEHNRSVIRTVSEGLVSYNLAMRPDPSAAPVTLAVRDEEGQVCAGLLGRTAWNWLRIDSVWVSDERRGKGVGRELILRAEQIARDRGCRGAHLDTFGFQAPDFYSRLGYQSFGQLEDYPDETHYFFKKEL